MFEILSEWRKRRKASKWKKRIEQVQCKLKQLKNTKYTIVRQLREEVGRQLFETGHEEIAFNRVEHIIVHENIVKVYELLDHYCELILLRLSTILFFTRDSQSNDIMEAVSSLMFASARCGDLPELLPFRKLFTKCYGSIIVNGAIEMRIRLCCDIGSEYVNEEVRERLTNMSVIGDNMVQRKMDEIAKDYGQKAEILAFEDSREVVFPKQQNQRIGNASFKC